MPSFRHGFRALKLVFGVAGGVGFGVAAAGFASDNREGFLPTALAAWTTNHAPSVKWDHNWDR